MSLEDVFAYSLLGFCKLSEGFKSAEEIDRAILLLKMEIEDLLQNNAVITSSHFANGMKLLTFKTAQEKALKLICGQDDTFNMKPVIRAFKDRINASSYDLIKKKTLQVLVAGAWFPLVTKESKKKIKNSWRFYQLSPNRKVLHYQDYAEKQSTHPPSDSITEKIEISSIFDMTICKDRKLADYGHGFILSCDDDRQFEFLFISKKDFILWNDGISILLNRHFSNAETSTLVQELTDLELNIRLSFLKSENILISNEIPQIPSLPSNFNYYFEVGSH